MTMLVFVILGFALFASLNSNIDAYKSYDQYQLWRFNVTNDEQLKQLIDFRRQAYARSINFWSEDFRINAPVNYSNSNSPFFDDSVDLD